MTRGIIKKIRYSIFWTKLTHWEYWPFNLVYFPISFYWIWLAIKARSFFFFSASNPSIEYGGMLGESKFKIHQILPVEYVPVTVRIAKNASYEQLKEIIKEQNFVYPIILKPDIGERGWMVEKIESEEQLKQYHSQISVDYLVQEYLDLPVELGVFYYRFPGQSSGEISSIVKKQMLQVQGTGQDSVRDLMMASSRARLQIPVFEKEHPEVLNRIPEPGEDLELMPIGNHSRGTAFLNANYLINKDLINVFDNLCDRIEGFYFGRFDIRAESENALYEGKFKIMELNGAGSEPGHIYHPGSSLFKAYQSIISHLKVLYEISRENERRGVAYMTFSEGLSMISTVRRYNRLKSLPRTPEL